LVSLASFFMFCPGANWFLALAKPFLGICWITMGEMFYWLVIMALCLQFHNAFTFHLSSY
jgi:hypothetical protein